ncbi:hypothetical protein BAOM_2985 [Peribacillus asahii]|uniref:Uncharacterized protein n=1 Tax=Peribacillus asahii TaxID=228899 RepID=A0A3Q9RP43_9BACI|nr:hypothetical protein [Peribacillus asahii]AZV43594.1 hypothetical protein BAOM_2985 [Peribacillus asahii]
MNLNDEQMLSEIISYYNDFDGELEESLFNWLVSRFKELKKENEELKVDITKRDEQDEYDYWEWRNGQD